MVRTRADHGESQLPAEEREDADGDDHVVQQRDDRADGERQLETERDVNEDAENAESQRPERSLGQLAADERADALRALHFELRFRQRLRELLLDRVARVQRAADRDVILAALRRIAGSRRRRD